MTEFDSSTINSQLRNRLKNFVSGDFLFLSNFTKEKSFQMIYRRELLDQIPSEIRKSIQFLQSILYYDIHLIAISEEDLLKYQSFEKRHKAKICRTNWKNAIAQKKGVIFIISSGMFFRKKNSEIESSIEYLKEFIDNNSFSLKIDQIEKSEKFDVYFLGIKEDSKNSDHAD